jgi:glycosyltransferase involved in cell wall biosynthesis
MTAPRVAIVAHSYLPTLGGVERDVEVTSRILSTEATVRIFVPADVSSGAIAPASSETAGDPPVGVRRLPYRQVFQERVIRWAPLVRELREFDPTIVWTHHPSGSSDLASCFARLQGLRWVATYHADTGREKMYGAAYTRWECANLRSADLVIAQSDYYRERLLERGVRSNRIARLDLGAYIGKGSPPQPLTSGVTDSDRPGPDHPFLFVGGLDHQRSYKRPERLVQAVARLRSTGLAVNLVVVGDGDRRPQLEQLAARLEVSDRVHFIGRLDDEGLAGWFRCSWAFVLPSEHDAEGFGTVCLEAITYGCPVIGSRQVPGPDLLAREGAGLTFDAAAPEALERAMASIWGSPELRRRLSRAATRLSPRFQWANLASSYREAVLRGGNS